MVGAVAGSVGPVRLAVDATALVGPGTGVAAFTRGVLAALAHRPVEVRAYALSLRGRRALAQTLGAEVGIGVVSRPMAAGALLRAWAHLPGPPIEWFTGSVDVVHGTNFVVPPARRAGRVVTVHDLTAVRFPHLCTPTTRRYPGLIARAVATGAVVHTPSRSMAAEVVEWLGVPAERVVAVPNGVDRVDGGDADRGRRLAEAERYVLALGTVEPRKGLPVLVEAFDVLAAGHPDLHLVLAGPDGWGAEALRTAMAGAGAGARARIHRVGFVAGPDRADLLAGAALLAYPSLYEGFGLPPLEAMSAGVPVVASDAGALPEVLGDGAELVEAGSAEALAAAMAALLGDDARRRQLTARGRRRAASYTWDRCTDGLLAVYERARAA